MRFSILGPLRVDIDGKPIHIERPRRRSILSYLLLQTNRPVTTDQLVTAIWGDHPVPTANTQVHTAVSVLRKTFREVGPDEVIENLPTGYRVSLTKAQLDVLDFTSTVSSARNGTDTPEQLRRALDLWQGQALDGITAAFADGARARLEEERLFVFEKLMDLEIERGNGRDITPELMGLVELHPLRESLVERLMLALYRGGRKSDAVREYARVRERLSAELGVEPGPDLRRLHLEILQDGPTVHHRAARPTRIRQASPQPNLPLPSPVFTGRAAERTQLRYALTTGERTVVSLHGAAGVGKSAVAIQAAHDISCQFPDGQLYIDLRGSSPGIPPLTESEILRLALRDLGVSAADIPPGESAAAHRLQELTEGSRLLLLLDNAAGSSQVAGILRAVRHGCVIVTSRAPLHSPESDLPLRIDVLPPADAAALLDRIAGRAGADWSVFNRIAAYCDYLPLALCIAGGRLARHPDLTAAGLAKILTGHRDRLEALEMDGVGVSSSIRVGYDPIASGSGPVDKVAAAAFCALGLLPVSSIDTAVVSAVLCPDDPSLATAALTRLARAQLVALDEDGQYLPHSLVRAAAAEYAAESMTMPQRHELISRAIAFYAACAARAEGLLHPHRYRVTMGPSPTELVPSAVLDLVFRSCDDIGGWLDAALPNLVSIATIAAASPDTAHHAITITRALSWSLRNRGDFQREHALAANTVRAADRLADPVALRRALINIGRVELYLGNQSVADGHYDRALTSARAEGDVYSQIAVMNDQSLAAINRGELSTAEQVLRECIGLVSPTASGDFTATVRHNLAVVEALLGRRREAARLLHEAIPLRHASTDPAGEGSDRVLLGVVYCAMGRFDEAVDQLSGATDTCERHGDLAGAWFGLAALTLAHFKEGRHTAAAAVGRRCLLVARSLGKPFEEKSAHHLLALALAASGEPDDARTHRRRAETIDAAPVAPDTRLIAALLGD